MGVMVERDEASPKLGIPNPSRSGNRFLEAEPAARNNRNQGKCLGTKLGALQMPFRWIEHETRGYKHQDLISARFTQPEQQDRCNSDTLFAT